MRKLFKILLLAAVATSTALTLQAKDQWVLKGVTYDVDTLVYPHQVGPGVTYARYDLPKFPLKVSVLIQDLTDPNSDMETYLANEAAVGCEDPLSVYDRYTAAGRDVVGAINGDFFRTSPTSEIGLPTSGMIRNDQVLITPAGRAGFVFDDDRGLHMDRVDFESTLSKGDESWEIHTVNCIRVNSESSRKTDAIHLFNEFWGTNAYPYLTHGNMAIVRPKNGAFKWSPNGADTVVVEELRSTETIPVPAGKAILWFRGTMTSVTKNFKVGDELVISFKTKLRSEPNLPIGFRQMVGGSDHIFLKDGQLAEDWSDRHPRTVIGFNADSTKIYYVVLDGRSTISKGATLHEAAGVLLALGAWHGMNLDGGGSSAMVVNGEVANRLSDGMLRDTGNGCVLLSTAPKDDNLGQLAFEPRSYILSSSAQLSFKVYGYNQYGVLKTKDVQGCTFSCDPQVGEFTSTGVLKVSPTACSGKIYADYNGLRAERDVIVVQAEKELLYESVVIDKHHDYKIDVIGKTSISTDLVDPSALEWVSTDESVCVVRNGVVKAIADGDALVIGTGESFCDTLKVSVQNPKARVTTFTQEPIDPSEWSIVQSGGKDRVVTSYENGMKIEFTGASSRSPYIKMTKKFPIWGLPDTLRLRYKAEGFYMKQVSFSLSANVGSQAVTVRPAAMIEEGANGEMVINLPTNEWIDASNLGMYPINFVYIQFNPRDVEAGVQYTLEIPGMELIYDPKLPTDVNEDGSVDVADLNNIINTILAVHDFFDVRADVNGDGEIDVTDINEVLNQILSKD